jgi:CelD/BcsL family acetyltransferase involved in cellulose biosynthesis
MNGQSTSALQEPGTRYGYRVLSGARALDDIEHLYRYLWARTDPLPPMQDFDWARQWWDLHAAEGELFIVQVEDRGRPVALVPLYVRGREASARGVLRTMCFIGTGEDALEEVYGTNNGWLGAPEYQAATTRMVAQALRQHAAEWDRIWLANFAPDAHLAGELQEQLADVVTASEVSESCNWIVDMPPTLDDFYAGIPKAKLRTKFRAVLRKASKAGVTMQRAESAPEALAMFDDLVRLHTARWEARGEKGGCSSPVFLDFHRRMLAIYARQGRLWLLRTEVDGNVIAVRYLLQAGRILYDYLGGIDDAHRAHAPGVLSSLHLIEMAPALGIDALDLLAGDYGYKHRMATRQMPLTTFDAIGRTLAGRAFASVRHVRRKLRRVDDDTSGVDASHG